MGSRHRPLTCLTIFCSIFILVLGSASSAEAQAGLLVYVPNQLTNNVSVFRTNADGTLTAVTTIAVGTSPFGAVVRADQAFAYVSNFVGDSISVIDTRTQAVVQTIAAGDGPRGLALNPDNTRLYVANNNGGANSVTVYSVAEGTGLLATLTTVTSGLSSPRSLAVSPDGSRLYVVNQGGDSVRVFDTSTNVALATVAVGTQPIDIALNPAGTRAYVTNFSNNSASVIDMSSDTVVATVATGAGPTSVIVSRDGAYYYVANSTAGTIAQFDASSNTAIAPAVSTSGATIFGLGITPAGGFVYATNSQNDLIALFSVGAGGALSSLGTQAIGLGNSDPVGLGMCGPNGNRLLAAGFTFVANSTGALGCTLDSPVLTGGTFLINNAGLVFTQPFTFSARSSINTSGNAAEISGVLSGGQGFTKQGAGTLTLSGPASTPGPITVESGTLRLNGALGATSSIAVPANTILEGSGSTGGAVTVNGAVRPGNPGTAVGRLTTGPLTLASTATVTMAINGTTPGTNYDVVSVIGNVTLGGATLTTTLGFTPAQGQTFTLIDNLGTSPITGTFAGLPEGTTFDVGGTPMLISYTGGNGNDVTLYVTPVAPVLTTSASPGGAPGTTLFATATISGGASPSGTLTFSLYGPDDATCATTPVFVSTKAIAANGSYQSDAFTPSAAGVYRWVVRYSGNGNNAAVATACGDPAGTVTIGKANQTIAFGALPPRTLGDPPFTVSATATSGLPVTFSSPTPSVCTVSGNTVTLVGAGTCTIAADQAGDASYNAAPQVTQSFTVAAGCSSVRLTPGQLPAGIVALPYSQAFSLSGGAAPFTFSVSGGLPGGLALTNGVLSGRPARRGSFPITVTGTDANSCQASRTYALAVSAERRFLVGTGAGGGSATRAFNIGGATAGLEVNSRSAFAGGVTVAEADVDGNGTADVITGAGPGGSPTVTVFDGGSGVPKLAFFALASNFTGGVNVAAGDVTGDGLPEILVAPGCGTAAPSVVRAFDGRTGTLVRDYPLSPVTGCGFHVAAGDVNGDGVADIVVGSASLGPSFVRVINGSSSEIIREFFPYTSAYGGGVFVAAGDVSGDGFADIVTGAGAGGTPHVRVFDGTSGNQIAGALGSFLAYPSGFAGGVRVAAGDLNGDGRAEVITGAGPGGTPHARVFDGATTSEIFGLLAFDQSFSGGIFVAAPVTSARMAVDIPAARTTGTEVRVAGWALREISADGNGNDAIHVWAFPAGGGAPVFVGAAPQRVARPDVAAFFGGEFLMSGFNFTGTLASGTYDLVVYARNTRTLRFDQVRVFRVTVQ